MQHLSGMHLIGGQEVGCTTEYFQAFDPSENLPLEPAFSEASAELVARAVRLAHHDVDAFRLVDHQRRAEFLEEIGRQLTAIKPLLIDRAHRETGLPLARLEGELTRTVNQQQLFARLLKDGIYAQTTIDPPQPDRTPHPKPELRKRFVPLGPVAVFGASNFPLAFSVAGGDSISALAAGCPVIVKGHPAHPGTSELAGRAICNAVSNCDLPAGTFSLLQGAGQQLGAALVQHPLLAAAAFTGSLQGGRALFDLAAARPQPIPVYAEMGSVNPLFILPQALAGVADKLAQRFADSVTLGVGQFCTNPGLLFALEGSELDAFADSVRLRFATQSPAIMLHPGIKENYLQGLKRLAAAAGVASLYYPDVQPLDGCLVRPALFQTSAAEFLREQHLSEEVFGPATLILSCPTADDMLAVARSLPGQLTATVHAAPAEAQLARTLFRILETKAGRLLLNDFPTGVEVCSTMVHGGPYPATTDSRSTSVGTAAIERFLRPLCYQNFTVDFLPFA